MHSIRKHIVIAGAVNSGKSALFNALTRQEAAIVSEIRGTTTDPVRKAAELFGYGAVVYVDTAGWNDTTSLAAQRVEKTRVAVDSADLVVYVVTNELELTEVDQFSTRPTVVLCNKTDLLSEAEKLRILTNHPDLLMVSATRKEGIERLESRMSEILSAGEKSPTLIEGLVNEGGTVLLVVPIDSAAPQGRLILPQVQLLRDCLDSGVKCVVVRPTELLSALDNLKAMPDLVVTDSQVFGEVKSLLNNRCPLTGFSMLFARQKGDIDRLSDGLTSIENLADEARILVAEVCTHNTTHDDIGQVKIPALLQRYCQKKFQFTFVRGREFPADLSSYELVIHCGGCMVTRRMMMSRIESAVRQSIPITNYGLLLAKLQTALAQSQDTNQ